MRNGPAFKWTSALAVWQFARPLPNEGRKEPEENSNNTITKIPPHLKYVPTLPCEMSSVLKENLKEDDFCNNTFKKLTTGNNMFSVSVKLLSKVTVTPCGFYIKCSMCPPRIQASDATDQCRDQ